MLYLEKPPIEEVVAYLTENDISPNEEAVAYLMHYGMPRRSGRYPWGSGDDPYQHGSRDFLSRIDELKKEGWTETPENIKKEFGLTTGQYRIEKSIANEERRMLNVAKAKSLKADGLGETEIGRRMGVNESTVRSWLNEDSERRMNKARETAEALKKRSQECIEDGGMIDVGVGAERELNISKERLNKALYLLQREGYHVYSGRFDQVTNPGQKTTQRVLCPPGTEHKEIFELDRVHSLKEYISRDGGATLEKKFYYPESMDSKRMMIRYSEDGGIDKDGIIELRRGVNDLSLGESRYSQVRILVDGTHYLKGMAVYSDDMPDGVDVIFNTNKTKDVPMNKVLKEIKNDPDNPFGSSIKDIEQGGQYWYDPKTGDRVSAKTPGAKLGLINKRADEGDWTDWKDTLPSQFLAKQSYSLAKKQLDLAKADKSDEFNEICSLNNPTIKKHFLQKFADSCDSAAVHLKAAALPGQKYHVIIPLNTLTDKEVYAPGYEDGTQLALIRYPHGGTFEIPILTVNNKQKQGRDIIGNDSIDAIGINKNIADRLSGADFDGDTVMAIPTNDKAGKVKIISTPPLKKLEGFDPKMEYPERPGMKYMKDPVTGNDNTQIQMGVISNLITDMTLAGATPDELARAVRHSMVVIDAAKHKLDYKQSEIDNNISALKKTYQTHIDENGKVHTGGASTILSRSKGEISVDKKQGSPKINIQGKDYYDPSKPEGAYIYKTSDKLYYVDRKYDKETGIVTIRTADGKKITYDSKDKEAVKKYEPIKKVDKDTGEVTYSNRDGDISYRVKKQKQQSTRMAETDDAYSLVSDSKHPMELLYADHANYMKDMANQARKELANTGKITYSKTAKQTYKAEVDDLMNQLNTALLNTTRERAAQRLANIEVEERISADNTLTKGDIKKLRQRSISKYRQEVGSVSRSKRSINISDKQWEAIQAGAISETKLKQILNNTDIDQLRQRATPRSSTQLSQAKINKIKAMSASNYTLKQIADDMDLPTSTVYSYLKGAN